MHHCHVDIGYCTTRTAMYNNKYYYHQENTLYYHYIMLLLSSGNYIMLSSPPFTDDYHIDLILPSLPSSNKYVLSYTLNFISEL